MELLLLNSGFSFFPTPNASKKPCEKLLPKEAFVELIKLTVSDQFRSDQKQLYMKRLGRLSAGVQAYRYFWTNEGNSLKEMCSIIQKLCEKSEGYCDK